ncbi:MAG: DNA methyltransferase [Nocardioidaceae bacterium]
MRRLLGDNDVLAYLVMMTARLIELRRVLKPTGSLYLHCDPTASHYLKIILDAIFGPENFRNEIIWRRTSAHSSAKKYGPIHDVILYYGKSSKVAWNSPRVGYEEEYLDKYYKYDDGDGRLYWRNSLTAAGTRNGSSGQPWRGINVAATGQHWKFKIESGHRSLYRPNGRTRTSRPSRLFRGSQDVR